MFLRRLANDLAPYSCLEMHHHQLLCLAPQLCLYCLPIRLHLFACSTSNGTADGGEIKGGDTSQQFVSGSSLVDGEAATVKVVDVVDEVETKRKRRPRGVASALENDLTLHKAAKEGADDDDGSDDDSEFRGP